MSNKKLTILYAEPALKFLQRVDKSQAARLIIKIEENANQDDPLSRAKALTEALSGKNRYRIGDYRAIFIYDESGKIILLTILVIGHRKDVYR